jgi:cytochrome d ubiquinol oxidase subunit II
MSIDLPLIWAGLIAFAVLAYVVLDGFDLGIGVLFPFLESKQDRDLAMNSVAPVWDGNETWLVLGGGGLYAVFPLAYATLLPALYAPIIAMLLGLVFRGVSFEFRGKTRRGRWLWDFGFAGGSMVAAFAQGITLGALVQGIEIDNRAYAGGWWDWLTPFTVLTGFAVLTGYALLGATWLFMKTEDGLARQAKRASWITGLATLVLIGLVSVSTALLFPHYVERWFSWPVSLFTFVMPVLLLLCVGLFMRGLTQNRDALPFLAGIGVFVLGFVGIAVSFYPWLVPPHVTIREAAAPDSSLAFLLVGALVLVPLVLAYTGYAYWVFRGKVDPDEGYH